MRPPPRTTGTYPGTSPSRSSRQIREISRCSWSDRYRFSRNAPGPISISSPYHRRSSSAQGSMERRAEAGRQTSEGNSPVTTRLEPAPDSPAVLFVAVAKRRPQVPFFSGDDPVADNKKHRRKKDEGPERI